MASWMGDCTRKRRDIGHAGPGYGGPVILPTFVVAGAPRCGTTSLHYYLRQHPQVCMSTTKEPNYFLFDEAGEPYIAEPPIIRKSARRRADYEALFRLSPDAIAIGDASPLYLYSQPSPARMQEVAGDMKVVCLLRRPADRAWSHFLYAFPDECPARFAELVETEIRGGPGYEPYRTPTHLVRLGRYAEQVRRQQETFGAENVLVLLMDDLHADQAGVLATVCRFLGVDDSFAFQAEHAYNSSGAPARSLTGRLVRTARPTLKRVLPPSVTAKLAEARVLRADAAPRATPSIDPEVDRRITEWCADDVDELAGRIDRDLSAWQAA